MQQPAPTAITTSSPDDRATSFKPADNVPERYSGETLLIMAYIAFWLLAFALVLMSRMRQRALDDRIDRLERDIARARDTAAQPKREPADAD